MILKLFKKDKEKQVKEITVKLITITKDVGSQIIQEIADTNERKYDFVSGPAKAKKPLTRAKDEVPALLDKRVMELVQW